MKLLICYCPNISWLCKISWVHRGCMTTVKITKTTVAHAVTGFLWDTEVKGFGLRVTETGARSYVYQYRLGGREARKRRWTIGRHGSPWTPDSARTEARRLARLVHDGIDPIDADRERRRQAVDLAFDAYVDHFAENHLALKWGSRGPEVHRMLQREPVDILGSKPLPSIRRSDVSAVFDRLKNRPAVARYCFAALRKLFGFAVERGDIERSPMTGMRGPSAVKARDRVLEDRELATVWRASDGIGPPFDQFYRLLVLTGQRREEVAGMKWSELKRVSGEWQLPASRAKNGVAHIVPLSPQAIKLLDNVAGETKWPARGLVFTTTGETPISGFSRAKVRLDKAIAAAEAKRAEAAGDEPREVEPWRVHDIRRTVATGLQRLGVRLEVTEAVLNHVSGSRAGIVGVYQRHDWKEEKRAALQAWSEHVSAIVGAKDL